MFGINRGREQEERDRREYEQYIQEEEKYGNIYDSDSDGYESEDEYRRKFVNYYVSDSDRDEDDYFNEMEEKFVREIKRMIYLGPLYKKCDSRKVGTTDKELKNRLDYLKKANRVPQDCSLSDFIDICKLHTEPLEADSCFVNLSKMVKSFQVDSIKSFMWNGRLTEDMLYFLLSEFKNEINLSVDILIYAIFLHYEGSVVKKILEILEHRKIFPDKQTLNVKYNKLFTFNLATKIVNNFYNAYLVDDLFQYLLIPVYFDILLHIPIQKLADYNYFRYILNNVSVLELEDYSYVSNVMIDLMYELMNQGEKDNLIKVYNNLKTYDKELINRVNHILKEKVDLYEIDYLDVVEVLIELKILDKDFDIEEYNEELVARELQREQGIDATNVHSIGNNSVINKIIKTLIPNPNKERNSLNLEFTTVSSREFIELLNEINTDREKKGTRPLNVNVEDVLKCQDYFFDYADRLTGRDRTPPGEGVEVCNVFVEIWNIAKEQLKDEELKSFTERLGEEFESILRKDNQGVASPVCSTGWGTRLVNSIVGTAIDVGVVPTPDINVIVKELNLFVTRKRAELDDESKEAEAFDDSIAMISDDNFEVAKDFINRRLNEFINKVYNEYKFTGIRKKQVRELANQAKEKLFTP